jgi:protein TonB
VVQASSVGPESEKLSPEVAAGSLLYRVEPEYPAAARAAGIEGPVVLAVHIGPDGSVKELKQLSGSVVLGQAAMEAVKNWRFKPHAINGQPSEMETTIKLNFKMQR